MTLNSRRSWIFTVRRNRKRRKSSLTWYLTIGVANYGFCYPKSHIQITPEIREIDWGPLLDTDGALPFDVDQIPSLLVNPDIILGKHSRIILYRTLNKVFMTLFNILYSVGPIIFALLFCTVFAPPKKQKKVTHGLQNEYAPKYLSWKLVLHQRPVFSQTLFLSNFRHF